MTTYTINNELNGIEIKFTEKPGEIIRGELKKSGFRWHKVKKVWYAKQTPNRLALAEKLANPPASGVIAQESEAKEKAAAWTAERMSEIVEGYTFRATGDGLYAGWTGCNNGDLYGQELKKAILAELKKNGIKATARERSSCYHTAFTFTVKVPAEMIDTAEAYAKRLIDHDETTPTWIYNESGECIHREALPVDYDERAAMLTAHARHTYRDRIEPKEAFEKAVKAIVSSFNSDHSNSMIDYFDRKFYDHYRWTAA